MKEEIIKKLREIEKVENLKILHAVESGSRAWGFASPDSDYDVRFIYIRPKDFYLKLDKIRDVVEYPINALLDINGWDLSKTLRLLHSSNPTLFEWSNSPIVYLTSDFFLELKSIVNDYFKQKAGLYHYLNMAESNYREYLKRDIVRAKKYFYVVRPLLACRWILKNHCPPPMLFSELVEKCLEPELKPVIAELLELKMKQSELGEIPKIERLNAFIEENLISLKSEINALPKEKDNDWEKLNKLFLKGF